MTDTSSVTIPAHVIAGETVRATFPRKGGSAVIIFRAVGSLPDKAKTIAGVANGDCWEFAIDTDGWDGGAIYAWQACEHATHESEITAKHVIASGYIELEASILADGTFDPRTIAEKNIEILEKAQMAAFGHGNASGRAIESYSIDGRSVKYMTQAEIAAALDYWRKKLSAEIARRERRLGIKRIVKTAF